jgi:hypothetical protein
MVIRTTANRLRVSTVQNHYQSFELTDNLSDAIRAHNCQNCQVKEMNGKLDSNTTTREKPWESVCRISSVLRRLLCPPGFLTAKAVITASRVKARRRVECGNLEFTVFARDLGSAWSE